MSNQPWPADPGQTPIEDNEQEGLIPSLFTRGQLNALELENINSARVWAMSASVLSRDDLLTDMFARELHRRMFSQVWMRAGTYRQGPRNLGWEPHRISEGVRTALDDAAFWLEHGTYPLHECAIRLHYRLVLVHPWVNGNGRHARLLADVLVAARKRPPLSWGGAHADLLSPSHARKSYLSALRDADAQNFGPLLQFCR